MIKLNAKDKIVKAKVMLQKSNPFFAYLISYMDIREDNKKTNSIGVNSKGDCVYNTDFIDGLSDVELQGVLAHEVLHLALEHMLRGKKYEHEKFNISADLVINSVLIHSGFNLPRMNGKACVPDWDNTFRIPNKKRQLIENLDKKTAEEVYREIEWDKELEEQLSAGRFDEHEYSDEKENGKEFQKTKEKWNKAFSEASVYAKQQGKVPKGMERLLDAVLNEKVNWKYLLYRYLTRVLPYDYTYNRPSKKSISTGFYMPSILKENIEIVVSVDTSGSINQEELSEFLGEIVGIAKSFNNIHIKIIVCDCKIHEVYDIGNGDIDKIMNLKVSGGGGTSHKPVYEYIEKNLPNTKFVINFTDGYTSFPSHEKIKSVWVISKDGCPTENIPFGEVIRLE